MSAIGSSSADSCNLPEGCLLFQFEPLEPGRGPAFCGLPDELILHVFSFLGIKERLRAAPTCRAFALLAKDEVSLERMIRTRLPQVRYIDEPQWREYVDLEQYGLSFEGVQSIPTLEKVKVLLSLIRKIAPQSMTIPGFSADSCVRNILTIESPVVWMTLPSGLSVEKMIAIAAAPKKGTSVCPLRTWCSNTPPFLPLKILNFRTPIKKPYDLLIGTNHLRGRGRVSRCFEQGKIAVKEAGCEASHLLEVLTFCLFERVRASECVPPLANAMACCTEKLNDKYRVVIGSHPDAGDAIGMRGISNRFFELVEFEDGLKIFASKNEEFFNLMNPADIALSIRISIGVLPVFRPDNKNLE